MEKGLRPSLVLHVCCAPCSSYVVKYLAGYFDMLLYYYNPNIYPASEYEIRLGEFHKLESEIISKEPLKLHSADYRPEEYYRAIVGREEDKEGGRRCEICYELRMRECARLAKERGYDYFGTTLTVSPHKSAPKINALGSRLAEEYGLQFLYSDFKKLGGYQESIALSKELELYRQDYCGCEFSMWHE